MGLPTVAMGVLGTFMLPAQAASLLILPSFITNVWQLLAGPGVVSLVRRFWLMMAGIMIGTVAAASFIAGSGGLGRHGARGRADALCCVRVAILALLRVATA
jgi:uncharacterized protein